MTENTAGAVPVLTDPQRRVLVDMPKERPGVRRFNPPWIAMARKLHRMGLAETDPANPVEKYWRTELGDAAVRSRKGTRP